MRKETPTPSPSASDFSHDLLDAEAARLILKMPQAKFELLVSSGQLPIFRSNGRTCFRREDIVVLELKRREAQAKAVKPNEKPSLKSRQKNPPSSTPVAQPKMESFDDDDDDGDSGACAQSPSTRSRSTWLVTASAIVVVLILALTFAGAGRHNVESSAGNDLLIPLQSANCKAAPGLVEAVTGERQLSFEVPGKLRAVYVEEGQCVKAGDRIAELENADLLAKVKSSQADQSVAEAKLGILKSNLESDLKKAESEVARLQAELVLLDPRQEDIDQARADTTAVEADARRLAEDEQKYSDPKGRGSSWSIQLYDQARGLSAAAAAKLAAARAHLRALESGSRPEEKDRIRAMLSSAEAELSRQKATNSFQLQSAQAQLDQTKAQVDLARAELEKTRIVSVIDGTVVRKYMHPGEVIDVLRPQPVVTVADLTHLRVRADVDEADFSQIKLGQRVKITADALKDGEFIAGTVEQVSFVTGQKRFSTGDAKERMDVKIVETIVKFDAPPPASLTKLGLRVTAFFELPRK